MNIDLLIHPRFSKLILQKRLKAIARKAMRAGLGAVSIYITTDAEMRKLNRQFHATDAPTDVLSFSSGKEDYLGDIVISYERARIQAQQVGWRIADELDLLAVHGILHLLGYDDLTPRQRAAMWKKQAEILGHPIPEKE